MNQPKQPLQPTGQRRSQMERYIDALSDTRTYAIQFLNVTAHVKTHDATFNVGVVNEALDRLKTAAHIAQIVRNEV